MLEVKDVQFSYPGQGEPAFDFNLSAQLEEICVVEGKSGVGKSTLLNVIAGLLVPQSGGIYWRGEDITGLRPDMRPLSMIFQADNLFDHLSCRQNVAIGLHPHMRLNADEWRIVDAALEVLGIEQLSSSLPQETSGGQQQRMALARALVRAECQGRDLLLLDEPFSALDPITRKDCIDAVLRLMEKRPMTALIVSHDPEDAKALGARRILLK